MPETPKNLSDQGSTSRQIKILRIILIVAISFLILGAVAAGGNFYLKYRQIAQSQKSEAEKYSEIVGKFMRLPDEKPALATVLDAEKLKERNIFENADTGDKVLFYSEAKQAILYRPSENKVIDVILSGETKRLDKLNPQTQVKEKVESESSPEAPKMVEVSIYNGTDINGLAKSVAEKISDIESISVAEKTNAKENYSKTLVIDISGNNGSKIEEMIKSIGGKKGELPVKETKPEADILIIAGSDQK